MLAIICAVALGGPPEPHEKFEGEYIAPTSIVLSPAGAQTTGDFTSVQVNLLDGFNVLNDAANEPSIAVDPTAPLRIVIAWRQFDTIDNAFRQAGWSRSLDGGRTWQNKQAIEPGIFRSDPVLAADAEGRFYYLSLHTDLDFFFNDVFISEDGAETWPIKRFAYGGDKAWFTIDRTGGPGHGHLYQNWGIEDDWPGHFNRSTSGGHMWEVPVAPQIPLHGTLDVDNDGVLYVGGRFGTTSMKIARSDNARNAMGVPTFTYSYPALAQGVFHTSYGPSNPGGLNGQVELAINRAPGPHDGEIYVVWESIGAFDDPEAVDVVLFRSDDSAASWQGPFRVSDDVPAPVQRWFGTMDVSPNGRIDVIFNDNREAPNGEPNLTRTYYTSSTDGGLTWSADEPVGPEWDSHVGWPNQNKIGDYYHMISDLVGANLAYATTYNGEQDVYHLRIGDHDCNGNGVSDLVDIDMGVASDCNGNDIPDSCEIAVGTLVDTDGDGVPDACACPADFNADGVLNVLDFLAFQLAWQAGEASADCNRDADFSVLDFICFQTLYAAGCD